MWQTDWAETSRRPPDFGVPLRSSVDSEKILSCYLLSWTEHCIECAVPDCYSLCHLYVQRRDRKCARFKQGISPNPRYPGLFPFGAEIQFRKWGKLESTFGYGSLTLSKLRALDRTDRALLGCIRPISTLFRGVSPYLRLNGAYTVCRERLLQAMTRGRTDRFNEFVIEVSNLRPDPVRLVLECWQEGLKFRTSILLGPGRTLHRISAAVMNINLYGCFGTICVYPENDAEAHLVFSWLDFVRYLDAPIASDLENVASAGHAIAPAGKVKCVIWDLDQTVWEGILGEQEAALVTLRPDVLRTMQALDERGVLQSIASKNDYEDAWNVLERLGIAHFFLYPQINWEPKSVSVQRIVRCLNIGIDSCAFIDDSPFERAEVARELGGVRVLADSDVHALLDRPEFDVPITVESGRRRSFYHAESKRQEQATQYGDRYEAFLRTCKIEAALFRPTDNEQIERCLELLHRSNQLNLSTHRYTREEFDRLLAQPDGVCICTSCRDRFGDYGTVGFASLEVSKGEVALKDFVLSCRVAQKKLENGWFRWLASFIGARGYRRVRAMYTKTPRNGALLNALRDVGFVETSKGDKNALLELDSNVIPPAADVVSIAADGLELITREVSLRAEQHDLNSEIGAHSRLGRQRFGC